VCQECGNLEIRTCGDSRHHESGDSHLLTVALGHGHALALHAVEAACHEQHLESFPQEDNIASEIDLGAHTEAKATNSKFVALIFALFVIFGTGNAVLGKLAMIPMYNYPAFYNVWTSVLYIPLCYLYVYPAVHITKSIPKEQLQLPKWPFAVMATFDALSSTMVMMAATYLPGPLLVLLPQAAIPCSMVLSAILLKAKYGAWQYFGAFTVLVGIGVVLEPLFSGRHLPEFLCVPRSDLVQEFCYTCEQQYTELDCLAARRTSMDLSDFRYFKIDDNVCSWESSSSTSHDSEGSTMILFWSSIMLLSTVPLSLSSIYKESYSNRHEIDAVYINLWICVFQLFFSLPLSIPAGYLSSPSVGIYDLPTNFWNGLKCSIGIPSVTTGCHPDVNCPLYGPLSTALYMLANGAYSILMILILKHGSANLMFLALTLVIPTSNLWFALPFMPQRAPIHASDLSGLIVIMVGLVCYRFGSSVAKKLCRNNSYSYERADPDDVDINGLD